MNDRLITFIIYFNNFQYYNECVRYIYELEVPEDYEIDIITIPEADRMATGYNEAINSCNAKYKIYMNQDVFIVDRRFIFEIVEIFNNSNFAH